MRFCNYSRTGYICSYYISELTTGHICNYLRIWAIKFLYSSLVFTMNTIHDSVLHTL